jgi:hypothetical protein
MGDGQGWQKIIKHLAKAASATRFAKVITGQIDIPPVLNSFLPGVPMAILRLDQPYPWPLASDGWRVSITGNAPIQLTGRFTNPTRQELDCVNEKPLRVGLVDAGAHTFFWLVGSELIWADMPYAIGILPRDEWPLLKATTKLGYAVTFVVVDQNNIVRCLRVFTVSPKFSLRLDGLLAKLMRNVANFTPARHLAEIQTMYARHSNTLSMFGEAILQETAGMPFPESES